MEGIITQDIINALVASAEAGQWWRLVGAILVALCALARFLVNGRLTDTVRGWVLAVVAVLWVWAGALMVGGRWWSALLMALFVSASSKEFWAKVRELLPKAPGAAGTGAAVLLVLVLPLVTGCEIRRAQTGIRTGLVSVDEGVAAADQIVARSAEEASDAALERIETECPPPCPDAVARFRAAIATWIEAARALRVSHEALVALDEALEVWIATETLPASWPTLCDAGRRALEALLAAVDAATGGEVPEALEAAPAALAGVCALAAPFVEALTDDDDTDDQKGGPHGHR